MGRSAHHSPEATGPPGRMLRTAGDAKPSSKLEAPGPHSRPARPFSRPHTKVDPLCVPRSCLPFPVRRPIRHVCMRASRPVARAVTSLALLPSPSRCSPQCLCASPSPTRSRPSRFPSGSSHFFAAGATVPTHVPACALRMLRHGAHGTHGKQRGRGHSTIRTIHEGKRQAVRQPCPRPLPVCLRLHRKK